MLLEHLHSIVTEPCHDCECDKKIQDRTGPKEGKDTGGIQYSRVLLLDHERLQARPVQREEVQTVKFIVLVFVHVA